MKGSALMPTELTAENKDMYQINEPGIVTDTKNNLMWKQELESEKYTWDEAREITSDFGGYSDWRLPTIQELVSLVDYTQHNPAIDEKAFPNQPCSVVWSGSPDAGGTNYAWAVYFEVGDVYYHFRNYNNAVRLVRGGGEIE